jgi:hypothetical protein
LTPEQLIHRVEDWIESEMQRIGSAGGER